MPRQDVLAGIPSEAELGPLFGGPLQLGLAHELRAGSKHRAGWLDFQVDAPCTCVLCVGLTDEQRAWKEPK